MKLGALAEAIGARLIGDAALEVARVRDIARAGPGDVTFAAAARELRAAAQTGATAVLLDEGIAAERAHTFSCAVLACAEPAAALVAAVSLLHPEPPRPIGVDARACVAASAHVGAEVFVGPFAVVEAGAAIERGAFISAFAYIGASAHIGARTRIGVGAVILDGAVVGADVTVGPHSVIGDEGFVFAPPGQGHRRLRHIGGVEVGDAVDIGAGVAIDRGALGMTRIGAGARIDNHVQVGHDVIIGDDAVIVAQVGLAGHAEVGAGAVLAGQAGVQEHTRIGAGARVGGKAGVTRDVPDGAAVSGFPAIPHADWLRSMALVSRLRELERRIKTLEKTHQNKEP